MKKIYVKSEECIIENKYRRADMINTKFNAIRIVDKIYIRIDDWTHADRYAFEYVGNSTLYFTQTPSTVYNYLMQNI